MREREQGELLAVVSCAEKTWVGTPEGNKWWQTRGGFGVECLRGVWDGR
jgi:hypothetical protein